MREVTELNKVRADRLAAEVVSRKQRLAAEVVGIGRRFAAEFPGPVHQYLLAPFTEPIRIVTEAHEAQTAAAIRTLTQPAMPEVTYLEPHAHPMAGALKILESRPSFNKGIFDDETQRHLPPTLPPVS